MGVARRRQIDAVSAHGESQGDETQGGADSTYHEQLAMIGLATLLASPALMHGLKGRLHNLGLVAELLQKESAAHNDLGALRAAAMRRAETLRAEVKAAHRHVQLIEALVAEDADEASVVCDVRKSLEELLPTTRFEAARRRIVVRLDIDPAVERIQCAPGAFQRLVLAFVTQAVRHCGEHATVSVSARREGSETRIEFSCDQPLQAGAHAIDRKLMRLLAQRLGAQARDEAPSGLAFKSAP